MAIVAALLSAGCASSAAPPVTPASADAGHSCQAPYAYVVTTDTLSRGLEPRGFETAIVSVAPVAQEGRGVAAARRGLPLRTVADTDRGRGDAIACE